MIVLFYFLVKPIVTLGSRLSLELTIASLVRLVTTRTTPMTFLVCASFAQAENSLPVPRQLLLLRNVT